MPDGRRDDDERITRIAKAAIALSHLAPDLARLANEMAEGAEEQARNATDIAKQTSVMAGELEKALESLKLSSSSIGGIVHAIKRLADQSKILALNAGIEAANAGASGRAFGAVAVEVESLATRTSRSTGDVAAKVASIETSIQQAVRAAGLENRQDDQSQGKPGVSIAGIGDRMTSIAAIACQHSVSATRVAETGDSARDLCEQLLLSVGTFRIQAHARALRTFDRIATNPVVSSGRLADRERFLSECMARFSIFELFYMTDETGVQRTENIWFTRGMSGDSALGKDWSQRSWFQRALAEKGASTAVSDIYRSVATDSFCFTVSRAVMDEAGRLVGVLAADVNFSSLLESPRDEVVR